MTLQNRNGFTISLQRFYGKMEMCFTVQQEPDQSHDFEKDGCKKGVLCKLRTIQSKKSLSNPSYFKEKKTTYPELIIHSWWVLFNKSTIIRSNISVMRILLQHVNFLFDLFLFILGWGEKKRKTKPEALGDCTSQSPSCPCT